MVIVVSDCGGRLALLCVSGVVWERGVAVALLICFLVCFFSLFLVITCQNPLTWTEQQREQKAGE